MEGLCQRDSLVYLWSLVRNQGSSNGIQSKLPCLQGLLQELFDSQCYVTQLPLYGICLLPLAIDAVREKVQRLVMVHSKDTGKVEQTELPSFDVLLH